MSIYLAKLKELFNDAWCWLFKRGVLATVVSIAVLVAVLGSGVGVTVAATGGFYQGPAKHPSPAPSDTSSQAALPSAQPSVGAFDPSAINSGVVSTTTDPGEQGSYQSGTYGVRAYFLPNGVRLAAVFSCTEATHDAVRFTGIYQAGVQDLCARVGSRQGVSFFFPHTCEIPLAPVISVIMHGTNIDGTYPFTVPPSTACTSQIVTNPNLPPVTPRPDQVPVTVVPPSSPSPSPSISVSTSPSASPTAAP